MIEIIAGEKGKGKTKCLLEQVNASIEKASGSIVYIDKSQKHMYDLSNKVRLISMTDYPVEGSDEFLGFICGIISQDKDLEEIYFDSFLTIASITDDNFCHVIEKMDVLSEKFHVKFIVSVSKNEVDLPACAQSKVTISL